MSKKNLFNKKINKSVISITKRIESFFNFFKENFSYKKNFSKGLNAIDKRIFFAVASIIVTISSYFIIPAFYDKDKIRLSLENQILDQFNLNVSFEQSLRYGLFPRPHFHSVKTTLNYKSTDVAKSDNAKIFISFKNFFSSENIEIKDLIFKQTDFKISNLSYNFFVNLLNNNKIDKEINFIDSKLFYLDENKDIIFLANIKKLNFLFEEKYLQRFNSKLDIFNVPVSLKVERNSLEKKIFTEIKSYPLRLNIKDNSIYDNKKLDGELDLTIINMNNKINYSMKNESLNFNSKKNDFEGYINIKPFFFFSKLKLYQIDLKKIFERESILINFFKSQILNNKNLNGKLIINTSRFKNLNFLDEIEIDILLEEGDLFLRDLRTIFKDSVNINLQNTKLIVENDKLTFAGYVNLDFIDITNFYAHYQINRNFRKNIKNINFDFMLNLDDKFIEIKNLKVNGNTNQNVDEFLNDFNFNKEDIFNKIIVRNSVKNFLKSF